MNNPCKPDGRVILYNRAKRGDQGHVDVKPGKNFETPGEKTIHPVQLAAPGDSKVQLIAPGDAQVNAE